MIYLHLLKMLGIIIGLLILFTQVLMPMFDDELEPWWLFKKKKNEPALDEANPVSSTSEDNNDTPTKE